MRINKIECPIVFKRFNGFTLDLGDNPKKIIALVGANGCGKSSILDAILLSVGYFTAIGKKGQTRDNGYFGVSTFQNYNQELKVFFDNKLPSQIFNESKGDYKKYVSILRYRSPYRYTENLLISELRAIDDIFRNNDGASLSIDIDNKMVENYKRLTTYINKYRKENDLTDKQAINKILGKLNNILRNCLSLEISDCGDILSGKGTLFFKKKDQINQFNFNVLSSGEKEVVDILLDIFLATEEGYNNTVFIIDEPELHLNTNIQKHVLVEIEKMLPDTCQLWIATHSIGFLRALQEDLKEKSAIINFDGDFSKHLNLKPMEKTRENWKKLFKTALEDITELLAPKKIIYCEGRKDCLNKKELGMDANVYNKIFEEKYPDTLFLSSGGQTEPDKNADIALQILNKAFIGADIYVLKDKDINSDGSKTTDEQRIEYLNKYKNRRMLKRREIENYLCDYEILSQCQTGLTQQDYNNIFNVDIINDDVKKQVSVFKDKCGFYNMSADDFKVCLAKFVTENTSVYKELESCIFNNI